MDDTASSRAAQPRCLECGAETAPAAQECTRCGAPISLQQTVTAAPTGWPPSPMWPPENYAPDGPPGQQAGPGSPQSTALIWGGVGLAIFVLLIVVIGVWAVSRPAGTASPAAPAAAPNQLNQLISIQLRAGDCLAGSNMGLQNGKTWPTYVTLVACTKPHEAEVFFAANVWHPSQAYPGPGEVASQADARCDAELAPYDGIEAYQSALHVVAVVPDSPSWASGDRDLICVAFLPSSSGPSGGRPVTSSIKGTDQ